MHPAPHGGIVPAMAQGGAHFIPPGQKPCASCGGAIDPARALYSAQGELVCDACFNSAGIDSRLQQAARGLAMGSMGAACLSWICNPLFITTVIAVGNSVAALRLLVRPDVKEALGARHGSMQVLAIVGLVIAAGRALLDVAMIALATLVH